MARSRSRGEEAAVKETTHDVGDDELVGVVDEHDDALAALPGDLDDPDLLRPAPLPWRRRTAIEMIVSGLIGLYTSFVLSIEAIHVAVANATNTTASASCDLNAFISCSAVADTWQAQLFGFPNAFLGIAAEAIVITVAIAMLGGVVFPRWFMLSAQAVYTAGLVFAWWLFQQSFFEIGALCPWCLLITATTTLVWAGLTRVNVRDGHLTLPGRWGPWARRFVASGNDWFVTVAVLVLFAAVVFAKYGWTLLV
ncbi:vitamin K epoxide reductase family protein [Cellulomonas dongxiuzhuiae]|uniref:Vitamin K epoxide reductase family protein n=1 Tax=Cellulomonas dongxiuzhuiae TaxID=2819979 RepID=A0ABX8GN33_9CELL|nr:vitamin K epoxide reductase family protein [Cellulomonas dongxiuzhuiae]QWC16991.1 vitamin K epoxide reductase family protein [Cellulomonas dongxiuzhuiae]